MTTAEELASLASRLGALGEPCCQIAEELKRLIRIVSIDHEMAMVRGRRVIEILVRSLYAAALGAPGTRPLDTLINELESRRVIPRETVAHLRGLKSLANLGAHDGQLHEDDLMICLIHLAVILKWAVHHFESCNKVERCFLTVEGSQLDPSFPELRSIFEIDSLAYGTLAEEDLGTDSRSRSWFQKNPDIYTILYHGQTVVGYSNIMPLEPEAVELARAGKLRDGLIDASMISRYEMPSCYTLYVCSLAIIPEHRRSPRAFRALYDAFFQKLLRLADMDIFVGEILCDAWTSDGAAIARSFGMKPLCAHEQQGQIYRCSVVPPDLVNPVSKLKVLLDKYREFGL